MRLTFSPAVLIVLLCLIHNPARSAIDIYTFDNAEQEQLFYDLSKQLRCPKCQNQNISDSNAQLAKDLRNKTYLLVKQGKSEQQVIDYMVARFGNFVRYDPPLTPATLFLWLGPLLFIVLAFYFLYRHINKQNQKEKQVDAQELLRLQDILGEENAVDKKNQQESKP